MRNIPLQNVLLDGFTGTPTGDGGEVEVSLDIEDSISMATNLSKVIVYEAGPNGNWHDILNRMANDNLAKQLSCSWYIPGGTADATADLIFQQMAAQGQSFFTASGDDDADTGLISFPGDTPYITQVGGTTLTTTGPGGGWVSEQVWNWDNGIGSAGGISTQYPIPTWQTNISMTANQGSTTMRNTPDVALTADNVYVRADGFDYTVGGTSCAAPLWAGFTALVNQQAAGTGQAPIGFINPAVDAIGTGPNYALVFHDITTGNNTSPSSPSRFYAVTGYDLCTGWGTPAGQALINALANPEPLLITPITGFTAIGGVGGPFSVTAQSYSLTNIGTNTFTWTLSNTSIWLTASSTSGTLAPHGTPDKVKVSLNNTASNLVVGTYTATVWFTNQNDDVGQSRQFTLSVISPPSITQQPANQAVLEGATAEFNVQATGGVPLAYQWQFNGTNLSDGGNISGSATTDLAISDVSAAAVGIYTVVVTNYAGTVTSSNASLTITPSPPVIVSQPASEQVLVGTAASFSVGVVGTTPYFYQWSFNGTNLPDATNAVLTVTDAQLSNSGLYAVLITNSLGSNLSSNALLTVTPCDPLPSGIISWWPGEGNSDDVIGTNNGTLVGAVGYTNGEVGLAFALDGYEEMVTVGNPPSLQLQDFTIEAWIKRASPLVVHTNGGNGIIFGYGAAGYALYFDQNGTPTLTKVGISQTQPAISITDTKFHHLAATKAGSTVVFYVDGVAYSAPAYDPGFEFTTVAAIGGRGDNLDNSFLGVIDETTIYNRALASNEIAAIYQAGYLGKCYPATPPLITAQPADQIVSVGQIVTFAVAATGSQPLSFQWSLNGSNLVNATSAALTLTNVQLSQSGTYSVAVSNVYGFTNSFPAVLTVVALPPTITAQPASQAVYVGATIQFMVGVTGSSPISYQWSFNSTNIANATNAILTLPNVQLTSAGNYSVLITNFYGATNSAVAVLTVNPQSPCEPVPSGIVAWWPGEGNANDIISGDNGTLIGAVSYTNGEVGQAIDFGGNEALVSVGNPTNLQLQNFTIEAWVKRNSASEVSGTGPGGNAIIFSYGSSGYGLYLEPSGTPALTRVGVDQTQPSGLAITDTNFHHLAVTKAGSTVVFYLDGTAYSAPAYNPTFVFTTDAAIGARADNLDNGFLGLIDEVSVYNRALASNEIAAIYQAGSYGKCSTTPTPPIITVQPTNETALVGDTAAFTVTAAGSLPLFYQWDFNGTNIANATNATLMLANVQLINAGNYSVLITNFYGSTTSGIAVLNVTSPPTCDPVPSGVVAWWPGEGNANDIVGTNNGTLVGAVGYTNGEVGQAFVLDGDEEMVTVGNPPTLQLQDFTIEAWIKRASPLVVHTNGGNGIIFGYGAAGYALYFDQDGTPTLTQVGNTQTQPAISITDTNSHHLAVTKSGSTVVFYVDGVAYPAPDYDPGFVFNTVAAIGGRGDNLDNSFLGIIDEVSVYNRPLASNEIAAIYQAGSFGKCPMPTPPTITAQPTNQTALVGSTAAFTVTADGSLPLSYQWSFNGTNIANATNNTLALVNVQLANAGNYSVLVTNFYGATNSAAATLSVSGLPPAITIQPTNQTVYAGATVQFAIGVTGTTPFSYQWSFNSTNIPNATNATLILPNVQPTNSGNYSVLITNFFGATNSGTAVLTVLGVPPTITVQPESQAAYVGATVQFMVGVTGSSPLAYQWSFNNTNIINATNAILTLPDVQLTSAGDYSVWITNLYGATNSAVAVLTVNPQSTCDPVPSGIVSWWPGEGNANDIIGTNNGTLIGAVSYTNGEVGQTFDFSGNQALVSVGNPINLQLQNFTIEAWVKRNSASEVSGTGPGGNAIIFSYGSGGYGLYLEPSGIPALTRVGIDQTQPSGLAITDTNFHHLAVTKAGSTVVFYLDGTAYSAPTYNPTFVFTTDAAIGARADNLDNGFLGLIDEVSVYNRALATNEIAAIYLAGSSGKCSAPTPPTILSQPANQSVNPGGTATFTVTVGGTPPLSYQWNFNGTNMAGATNATLALTNVQSEQAGNYAVSITNAYGSTVSSNAALSVVLTLDHFVWSTIASTQYAGQPFGATITAQNLFGVTVTNFTGAVSVQASATGTSSNSGLILNGGFETGSLTNWLQVTNVYGRFVINNGTVRPPSGDAPIAPYAGSYCALGEENGPGVFDMYQDISIPSGISVATLSWAHCVRNFYPSFNSSQAFQVRICDTNNNVLATAFTTSPGEVLLGNWVQTNYNVTAFAGSKVRVMFWVDSTDNYIDALVDSVSLQTLANVSVTPTNTGNFVNGVWTGNITVQQPATNIVLIANDGSGHTGASNPFNVVPAQNPPVITAQPQSQTNLAGSTASFSVMASGTPPLSYQWYFNTNTLLASATNAMLTLTNVQLTNCGYYSVRVTNQFGAANSSNALLIVQAPPAFIIEPTNLTVYVGNTAVLAAGVSGSSPLNYQWSFNATNTLTNGTNAVLCITNVQLANAGVYALTVTNLFGVAISSNATLTVMDTLDHFAWASIPSPRFAASPFGVTIQAMDSINQSFTNFAGTVALSASGAGGAVPVNPPVSGSFVLGTWAGSVVIGQTASNLVLQANDGAGHVGFANAINILATPSLSMYHSSSSLLLFWPMDPGGFVLETSPTLMPPQWTQVPESPFPVGDQNLESVQLGGTNQYYRLRYTLP